MAITNKVGPPVTGDDFYGREAELTRAHDYLTSYHSLVLSAPRRIGKSSFAKRLIEDKINEGWKCVYIDLEGVRTRDEFLQILISTFDKAGIWVEAMHATGGFISKILESIKGIGPLKIDYNQSENTENLYASLAEVIDHSKDALIVIDELTLFLSILDRNPQNHNEAEFFLNWFRSLRQVSNSKIRWIFCGSVGLHNFTQMRNLSMTINDLLSFDFDALSDEEAQGLVKALAESENIAISQELVDYLLDRIEWPIPYFIQLLFTNIKNHPGSRSGINHQIIDDAITKLSQGDDLRTWSERLAEYNGYEKGARLILRRLSEPEDGLSREQLFAIYSASTNNPDPDENEEAFSQILNMIEHDGYIMRTSNGKRRFRSPLLRIWWYYKFVE
ncbi:MAG: ATP-binding protein [Muribaculaceae bacterium]|nr:ATP-binding protein [Muribaculaceae bacterium]